MTSALYLEHYLDSLEHLPIELQRNFTLMRDLDSRAQSIMRNIDEIAETYLTELPKMSSEAKKEKLKEIQGLFNKAKEYGDDKVQLAIQTYELVDKHIRRLDSDLARFEGEIQDKALSGRTKNEEITSKKGRKRGKDKTAKKKRGHVTDEEAAEASASDSKGRPHKKHKKTPDSPKDTDAPLDGAPHPSDVLDMPVDPNEPTYCLCHQVSYGEMIGCDNPDCPIEWFHFACVGLTTKPKGKWFCPKCTQDRKKK
ncbi:inhibitor of growth protein 4 isoform X1 [Ctenocephalides felis]|uniref:inhibitor of growth protein 4 isoform X1 n=2 Tax=Ctenocephalides felis TaxID=7515 RepID=UPI000E6E1E41|nr:inhibitor of growth protein 4 isoform X1 [Ctenocephalides felis]